jgi:hypothetical protein
MNTNLLIGVGLLAMTMGASLAHAAAQGSANTAQMDGTSDWTCPNPSGTTGEWFDVPAVAASLTTNGGPV